MLRKYRRVFAALAIAFGVFLFGFELYRVETAAEVSWFWVAVAILMVILGGLELLSGDEPPPPARRGDRLPLE